MIKYISALTVLLVLLSNCKKKDDVSPICEITKPDAMTHFSYNDVVSVKGIATDETNLKSIKIQMIGLDGSATDYIFDFNAIGNTQSFSQSFTLDDKHMPSGTYYIKVTVTDAANNWKSAFKEITYSELPLSLDNIYIVSKPNSFAYDLYRVAGSVTESIFTFSGDFQDILANSYWGQLMISGGTAGNLISFDPVNLVENWSKLPQASIQPFYGKMYQLPSDKGVYVAQGNNTAVSYDKNGQKQRTLSMASTYYPQNITEKGQYVLVEENSIVQNVISVYFKSTGSLKHQFNISGQVVKMLPKDEGEIYLITKSGNQAFLYVYYVEDNYTYEPHAIPVGNVYDACSVNGNEIFIAHNSGILKYTFDNNSMVNTISTSATQLEYDFLYDVIYASNGNSLETYDRFGNPGAVMTHTSNIEKFVLYYNK
jgi:hypothetical protein